MREWLWKHLILGNIFWKYRHHRIIMLANKSHSVHQLQFLLSMSPWLLQIDKLYVSLKTSWHYLTVVEMRVHRCVLRLRFIWWRHGRGILCADAGHGLKVWRGWHHLPKLFQEALRTRGDGKAVAGVCCCVCVTGVGRWWRQGCDFWRQWCGRLCW